jgi:hypothetical protein
VSVKQFQESSSLSAQHLGFHSKPLYPTNVAAVVHYTCLQKLQHGTREYVQQLSTSRDSGGAVADLLSRYYDYLSKKRCPIDGITMEAAVFDYAFWCL